MIISRSKEKQLPKVPGHVVNCKLSHAVRAACSWPRTASDSDPAIANQNTRWVELETRRGGLNQPAR